AVLMCFVLAGVFASLLAPVGPAETDLQLRFAPPVWAEGGSWERVLGADALGRDVLSRLLYGARLSLLIGFSVVLIAGSIGTALGVIAGFRGGRLDEIIMRAADAQLAFPGLLLILLVLGFLGPSIWL